MSWRAILTLVLLAGAIASGWSLWKQRQADAPQARGMGRPDYVLNDFELVALDATGVESFTLRAPRLARDPASRTMDIATPLFVIPPRAGADGAPWEVRSASAWVSASGDEIRLRGNVRADSTNGDGQPVRMATEVLNVFPETRRATSDARVTMVQPGFTISGRGLAARLDTGSVQLLSDIKARYEP